jgi:hypothetical protein
MSDTAAPVLPAVPARIQPPVAPQQPARQQPQPQPRAAGAAMFKTVFDAVPAGTVTARATVERARANLQAAVRAVAAAKQAADELLALTTASKEAAAIAEHEGLGNEVVVKFIKLTAPVVAAFSPADAAA